MGVGAEAEVEVPEGVDEAETVPEGVDEEACAALWGRMMNHTTANTIPATMMVARSARKMASGLLVYQRTPSLLQQPSFTDASFLSIDIIFIASPHIQQNITESKQPICYIFPSHHLITLKTAWQSQIYNIDSQ